MRWWAIPIGLVIGWFLFTLTPFWALYDLARAVQAGDAAYVEHHVNFRTLRFSLIQQLTAALKAGGAEASQKERQRIADSATILAMPLAEALVTPQMVVDLLDDGWPQNLDLAKPSPETSRARDGLSVDDLRRLGEFYVASDMRGFRTIVMSVPPGKAPGRQFKIRMRLRGWQWHLIEIELNPELRDRIANAVARASRSRNGGGKPAETPPETGSVLRP